MAEDEQQDESGMPKATGKDKLILWGMITGAILLVILVFIGIGF